MDGHLVRAVDDRAWRQFLLAGAALATLVAITLPGLGADALLALGSAAAAIAVGIGIAHKRPTSLTAWRFVFASVAVQFGLNLANAIGTAFPSVALPTVALEAAFLVPYLLLAIGLWSLARAGGATADRGALLDAFIIVLGLGIGTLLAILFVAETALNLSDVGVLGSFAISLPSLALAGWLALTAGIDRTTSGLLLAGVAAQSIGDGLLDLGFRIAAPAPEPAWLLALVCYGAASLNPARTVGAARALIGPAARSVLLAVAVLVPTVVDAIVHLRSAAGHDVLNLVVAGVVVLAVIRIGGLFRALELERRREAAARALAAELIETSPGIVMRGRISDDTLTYASPSLSAVLGYRPVDVVGVPGWWPGIIHPDDATRFPRTAAEATPAGAPVTGEVRARHADGSYRNLLLASRWELSSDGDPVSFVGTGLDVTDWRTAQAELSTAATFLDDVIHSTPAVFIRGRGPDRILDYVSPNITEVLGFRPDQVIGVPGWPISLIHPDDRVVTQGAIAASIDRQEERYEADLRVLTADGRTRTMLVITRRDFADDGTWQFTSTLLDVTERREVEDALREAHTESELASRAKSEFLSGVSHELRTPLNAVLGFGQLLERAELPDPDDRDAVAQILSGGRRLLAMIDDLLEIARMDAGRLTLSIEPISIDDIVRESVDLVHPAAEARGITLHLSEPDPTAWVLADARRLQQVFLNLLSNAVKFSPAGAEIVVGRQPGAAHGRWRISVADSGPGIAPELREQLFKPFRHGPAGDDQSGGDLGVGLAISAGLIEAMGGTIGLDSAPGGGSIFHVELPAATAPAEPAANGMPGQADEGRVRTIAYIEDNLSSLSLVERILTARPGTRLLAAMQGRLGIDLVRQHEIDLVLLDLHLPDITGEEVLEALRGDPRTRDVPILVLTSSVEPGLGRRVRPAGADATLAKPIDLEEFLETVDHLLTRSVARDA